MVHQDPMKKRNRGGETLPGGSPSVWSQAQSEGSPASAWWPGLQQIPAGHSPNKVCGTCDGPCLVLMWLTSYCFSYFLEGTIIRVDWEHLVQEQHQHILFVLFLLCFHNTTFTPHIVHTSIYITDVTD